MAAQRDQGPPETPGAAPQGSDRRRWTKLLGMAGVVVVAVPVPALVGYLVAGGVAAAGAVIGSFLAFLLATASGTRRAARWLPALLAAALVSAVLAGTWWWAVALAAIGGAAGYAVRYGRFLPLVMSGILFSVTPPAPGLATTAVAVAAFAAGALNGWLLARAVGTAPVVAEPRLGKDRALPAAVALAAAAGAAATIMLLWGAPHANWVPMTIFILAIPRPGLGIGGALAHRMFGTAAGAVAAGLLVALEPPPAIVLALGTLALFLGLLVKQPFWLASALTTVAVVLLLTPPGRDFDVAYTRVEATLLGAAIVALIVVVDRRWRRNRPPAAISEGVRDSVGRLTGSAPPVGLSPRNGSTRY